MTRECDCEEGETKKLKLQSRWLMQNTYIKNKLLKNLRIINRAVFQLEKPRAKLAKDSRHINLHQIEV